MNLWYPGALRRDGPHLKVWPDCNRVEGVICHSMEGSIAAALVELDRADRQASWHFSVQANGLVQQHYPLTASPWHAGSYTQNIRLVGIEHEGRAGEPLTGPQETASVALVRWIAAEAGWSLERHTRLLEHNEVYATACPSGRIDWSKYVPAAEEAAVEIRQLDQGESIAALNAVAAAHGAAITDRDGLTVVEVVAGSPVQPPPGGHVYLFTTQR